MEYLDHLSMLKRDHPALAAALGDTDSLEAVLAWMKTRDLPPGSVDLVAQDEFSYDFIIRLEPDRWLVFGVN
jgi:hypothetical protein